MEYLLIDLEGLRIVKRAGHLECGCWADLDWSHTSTYIGPFMQKTFSQFQERQLMALYKNTFGEELTLRPYPEMLREVLFKARQIECDPTTLLELKKRLTEKYPEDSAHYSQLKPWATQPIGNGPAPQKSPNSGPIGAPKAGSTTGRVWEIADEEFAKLPDLKACRKLIIAKCVAQGINPATAATQYSKWAQAKR